MKYLRWSIAFASFALLSSSALAQDDCPTIVESALAATEQACEATGRNQACYGNALLEAVPQEGINELAFRERGDLVDLALVRSLHLSPMNIAQNVWGVSLMRIQANLPDTLPGQNVTMLMFGDVELRVPTNTEPITIDMTATGGVNVRAEPATTASVIGGLSLGQTVTANGRLEDGSWLRIALPDDKETHGWVFAELVATEDDLNLLDVVDPAQTTSRPTQAFYFRTGIGDAPCEEAPNSGILIQTPAGAGLVSFRLNDVNIQLGSTAYVQAVAGEEMVVNVIEGKGLVQAFGVEQQAMTNMRIRVPLNEDLVAAGPPAPPERCDFVDLQALPGGFGDCTNIRIVLDHDCPAIIPYGMVVQLHLGAGWPTEAEAQAGLDEQSSQLIIDGQNIPVRRYGVYYSEVVGTYSYATEYDWGAPQSGIYEVTGIIQQGTFSCEVTILEPPE